VGNPFIIGHRGASAHAPENTLAAFDLALDAGADGIEFDVRLARDGVPVVIHDATLERTALRPGRVESLASSELLGVDAGTWFNLRFPSAAQDGFARERVPTLARLFERCGPRAALLYVEMKCDAPSAYAPLAAAVVRLILEHGLRESAVVKCFAHEAIREVKRLDPRVRTAALFEPRLSRPYLPPRRVIAAALACGADEISLHHTLARRSVAEAARREGLDVLAWTVDSPSYLRRARALGLRAVFTNRPALMRAALEELEATN
jgi:glycerophosphoryl diester phosphodiesterase